MRNARQSRVRTSLMAATMAGLVVLAFSDDIAMPISARAPVTAPVASIAENGSRSKELLPTSSEPVPVPVEIVREAVRPVVPVLPVKSQVVSAQDLSTQDLSTRGMGRSKDDFIAAADAISQHVTSLEIPVPREIVRVVALPPIDTRRLPEMAPDATAADLSGLFTLAAQSMSAVPAVQATTSRTARKPAVSISQGGIKRVAGFVKRSNVPAPVRVSQAIPVRQLVGQGTLRPNNLRPPAVKTANAAIVTSAHMVLSGQ